MENEVCYRVVEKGRQNIDPSSYTLMEEARSEADRNKVTGRHWVVQRIETVTVYDTAERQGPPRTGGKRQMEDDAMTLDQIRNVIQALEKEAREELEGSPDPRWGREVTVYQMLIKLLDHLDR